MSTDDGAYSSIIPWSSPSTTEIEIDRSRKDAEKAKILAATAIAQAMPSVVRVVMELLHHEDPQVQLRAADLLMSRAISKIAVKHVEDTQTVESTDTAALRESILEEINKRR